STSQSGPEATTKPDAAALLQQVKEKYATTKYYNIEAIEEAEWRGDLSRQWDKSYLDAATTSGNRYRFEGHNSAGWMTKISDGRTEWVLEPWPNFHDATGEIQRQFPPGSVPEVVLIDSSGKITYAGAGFDEPALRGAIAQLGPEFASLAAKP